MNIFVFPQSWVIVNSVRAETEVSTSCTFTRMSGLCYLFIYSLANLNGYWNYDSQAILNKELHCMPEYIELMMFRFACDVSFRLWFEFKNKESHRPKFLTFSILEWQQRSDHNSLAWERSFLRYDKCALTSKNFDFGIWQFLFALLGAILECCRIFVFICLCINIPNHK